MNLPEIHANDLLTTFVREFERGYGRAPTEDERYCWLAGARQVTIMVTAAPTRVRDEIYRPLMERLATELDRIATS